MTTPPGPSDPGHPEGQEPPTQPLGYWEQQAQQPSSPPPPPPTTAYPTGYPSMPVGAPMAPLHVPDHPKAATALVLGLVSVIGGFICVVPFAIGPWAWVIGRRAVKQIDAEPYRFGGRGSAMAGYVLGVIATILLMLGIIAFVGLIALLFASTTGFSEGGSVTSL